METEATKIKGVVIIKPKVFEDERGFFLESFNKKAFEKLGIAHDFVQDNHSKSSYGVVRGLHYQEKYPQGKLVRVIQGEVLDVVVDIRKESPTFAQWISVSLSATNRQLIWVPGGLAHGFSVISETAELQYKVTDYYHPEDETGIRWDDPHLNIDWSVKSPVLSQRDKNLPFFQEIFGN